MRAIIFQSLYFVLSLFHLGFIAMDMPVAIGLSKPLLIPALFLTLVDHKEARQRLVVPLVFAWFGDMFLIFDRMPNQVQALTISLASYAVTHGMYAFFSLRLRKDMVARLTVWPFFLGVLGVSMLFTLVLWPCVPHEDQSITFAIGFYALMLGSFLMVQLFLFLGGAPHRTILWGALLFMLADATLLAGRFCFDVSGDRFLWMLLYLPAQYLIVKGFQKATPRELFPL